MPPAPTVLERAEVTPPARRGRAARKKLKPDNPLDGLSRGGKVVSKAQQRLFFARFPALAHSVARRGSDFKRLPSRKRRKAR